MAKKLALAKNNPQKIKVNKIKESQSVESLNATQYFDLAWRT